jgi:hypothetical protein
MLLPIILVCTHNWENCSPATDIDPIFTISQTVKTEPECFGAAQALLAQYGGRIEGLPYKVRCEPVKE